VGLAGKQRQNKFGLHQLTLATAFLLSMGLAGSLCNNSKTPQPYEACDIQLKQNLRILRGKFHPQTTWIHFLNFFVKSFRTATVCQGQMGI
jgi:hypothetical protein